MENKKIDLPEHKEIMLNILSVFSDFCEKNGLKYFLDAGTLIGAVRHRGFIPWDNDLDVCMPRYDYDRFLSLAKDRNSHLDDNIILELPENTIYCFLKLGDKRTRLIEFPDKNPIDCYIYIDVFPKDGIDNLNIWNRILCKCTELCHYADWFNKYSISYWKREKHGIKKAIAYIADLFLFDSNWAYKLQQYIIRRHNKRHPYEKCKYVTTLVNGEFNKCAPRNCFSDCYLFDFEGRSFRVPIGYDQYLRSLYHSDYMVIPSKEKQKVHNVVTEWR